MAEMSRSLPLYAPSRLRAIFVEDDDLQGIVAYE